MLMTNLARPTGLLAAMLLLALALPANGQIYQLPNPISQDGDFFGGAVAIYGDFALVGASGADICGPNSGAAYIYHFDSETGHWSSSASLQPDACAEESSFGRSVALGDSIAVVSSFRESAVTAQSNAAYVYKLNPDSSWTQTARLTSPGTYDEGAFASSVSLDSNRIAISTTGDASARSYGGAVYIFESTPAGNWRFTDRLTIPFERNLGIFGGVAALSGSTLAVTAQAYSETGRGSLHIFEYSDGAWNRTAMFRGLDDFFLSIDASSDAVIVGEKTDGEDKSGSSTLFVREDGQWKRKQQLQPANPFELGAFGTDVAITDDIALVVGYDEQLRFEFNIDRVVYVFTRDPDHGFWRQRHIIDIGDVFFGSALDIDDQIALVGRASDDAPGQAVIVHLNK